MSSDREALAAKRARVRMLLVSAGVVVVGLAGYVGFAAFSDSELGAGSMALAAATGFAAFFSPCSFPLMLTFLTRQSESSTAQTVRASLLVGAGALTLLAVAALFIAAGSESIGRVVQFDSVPGRLLRLGVGLVLILLGLRQANLVPFRPKWIDNVASASSRLFDPTRASSPATSHFVYGFGYLLAGFG